MNLIRIIILLFTVSTYSQSIGLIDTVEKYDNSIRALGEEDDCSVRAIAEAFNCKYKEAHAIVKGWGRQNGLGMLLSQFAKGIRKDFQYHIEAQALLFKGISPKQFVLSIAEDGYSYIVVGDSHVFVIEQVGKRGKWFIKGNYDDRKQKIIAYYKIKV